ncbi:hypothetical protein [Variovorax ginsengisoli]|uniref:DUF2917 domain-containing protein n=1 Tax=Variovorax ginsengisoli TaxID=363844 RepID=A0ABT9S5H4_9BURK|nr:hypothetical protein [Variovorax ginsengisoli]MDP9899609.1 hypothetical protein [Variovorax ginsengisoli]
MSPVMPSAHTAHAALITGMHLLPGETLHIALDARTTLALWRGVAMLHEAPAWLGEQMVTVSHRLAPGQTHRVAQSGWLRIEAQEGPVEIRCTRAPAWPAVAWDAVARHVATWRQALRGIVPCPTPRRSR